MSDAVHIKHVQTLVDLRSAFHRFGGEVTTSLEQIENLLRKKLDDLNSSLVSAQRDYGQCAREVERAMDALSNCENQVMDEDDGLPDCSQEFDELHLAKKEKTEAEIRLSDIRKWLARIDKQTQDYRKLSGVAKRLSSSGTVRTVAMIQNVLKDIERYQSVIVAENRAYTSVNSIDRVQNASSVMSEDSSEISDSGSEDNRYKSSGTKKWENRGICDVALPDLPAVNDINENEFKKVSFRDMQAGLGKFQELRKMIDMGHENSRDAWAKYDNESGLSYVDGYQKLYEAFYGIDKIRVTKDGSNYTIENGRHRIWLARKMGISNLPMSIVERTKVTDE